MVFSKFNKKTRIYLQDRLVVDTQENLYQALKSSGSLTLEWKNFYYDLCEEIRRISLLSFQGNYSAYSTKECDWEEYIDNEHVCGWHGNQECPKHTRKYLLPNDVSIVVNPDRREGLVFAQLEVISTQPNISILDRILDKYSIVVRTSPYTHEQRVQQLNNRDWYERHDQAQELGQQIKDYANQVIIRYNKEEEDRYKQEVACKGELFAKKPNFKKQIT